MTVLDLDPELIKLIHPDYPTPFAQVNKSYEDHTQQVIVAIVTWFDEQVPRHLVELAMPDNTLVQMLGEASAKIQTVGKIHQPGASTRWGQQRCAGCGRQWPCKTNSALYGWPDRANQANSAPAIDEDNKKP